MKTPTLREKKRGGGGADLPGWEWQRTGAPRKRDRMQARRSWNQFKWYQSAPPFSTSPPPPPPFSSSALAASQPFSPLPVLSSLFCKALQEREEERNSTASVVYVHLSAYIVRHLCFKETSVAATHVAEMGCWRFSWHFSPVSHSLSCVSFTSTSRSFFSFTSRCLQPS